MHSKFPWFFIVLLNYYLVILYSLLLRNATYKPISEYISMKWLVLKTRLSWFPTGLVLLCSIHACVHFLLSYYGWKNQEQSATRISIVELLVVFHSKIDPVLDVSPVKYCSRTMRAQTLDWGENPRFDQQFSLFLMIVWTETNLSITQKTRIQLHFRCCWKTTMTPSDHVVSRCF